MNDMSDMSQVIVPKSDQINADDLIGRDMTITIREVQIRGGQEQPVSIYFDGSDKAFRPCKSMSRVLVQAWGPDANKYVGHSLTLYRDPTVKWGGMEVGGIRISHMSHIDQPLTMALTATKGSRKPYTVKPLVAEVRDMKGGQDKAAEWARAEIEHVTNCPDLAALNAIIAKGAKAMAKLERDRPELHTQVSEAYETRRDYFADQDGDDADPFDDDTPSGDGEEPQREASDGSDAAAVAPPEDDEEPVWKAAQRKHAAAFEAATTKAEIAAAERDYLKDRAAFPDNVAARLDRKGDEASKRIAGE
jgi:hypothetical protein